MAQERRKINPLGRFKKGAIMAQILYYAQNEPFYGSWLKDELTKHGYDISYGTLYPWLNRLENSKLLVSEERTVGGKNRKYYSITEEGANVLQNIKGLLKQLYNEIIEP